jgi:hypothetical protein
MAMPEGGVELGAPREAFAEHGRDTARFPLHGV